MKEGNDQHLGANDSNGAGEPTKPAVVERPLGSAAAREADSAHRLNKSFALVGGLVVLVAGFATAAMTVLEPKAPQIELSAMTKPANLSGQGVTVDHVATPAQDASASNTAPSPVVGLQDLEVGQWPKPQTLEEAVGQIARLKDKLTQSDADAERAQIAAQDAQKRADEAEERLKAQTRRAAQAQLRARATQQSEQEEVVALSVLEVTQERVVVVDRAKPDVKFAVAQGARLPGGAVFIGYDPNTRLLRTDQGDFLIR